MNKMLRENKTLRCNVICKICKAPFEFIEDVNGDAVVKNINMLNSKKESMDLEFNAKCNICGYRAKYIGNLKL
ncbi:hypothetical protein C4D23_10370 [Clostridium perfringens]|uniref:hypothetical protein n=2 Tax=Clostridium perfringens TaxID=1502 RepID=UPI00285AD19E|nr:hypothetical protein [Clostridium perfringens]ELC8380365.1 hypothetical protein [Clostridium perfringens]